MKKNIGAMSIFFVLTMGLVACGKTTNDKVLVDNHETNTTTEKTDVTTDFVEIADSTTTTIDNTDAAEEVLDSESIAPAELTREEEWAIGFNESSFNLSSDEYLNAVRFVKYVVGDEIGPDNSSCYKLMGKYILHLLSTGEFESVEAIINNAGAAEAFGYHGEFDSIPNSMAEGMLSTDIPDIVAYTIVEASSTYEVRDNAAAYSDYGTIYNVYEIGSGIGKFMIFFTE